MAPRDGAGGGVVVVALVDSDPVAGDAAIAATIGVLDPESAGALLPFRLESLAEEPLTSLALRTREALYAVSCFSISRLS